MENTYLVVIDFLESKEELAPSIYWFTEKEKAINFAKEQIDYRRKIYEKEKNFFMDFFQWIYYVPWILDIRVREIPMDFYISNKDYQKHANCLAK